MVPAPVLSCGRGSHTRVCSMWLFPPATVSCLLIRPARRPSGAQQRGPPHSPNAKSTQGLDRAGWFNKEIKRLLFSTLDITLYTVHRVFFLSSRGRGPQQAGTEAPTRAHGRASLWTETRRLEATLGATSNPGFTGEPLRSESRRNVPESNRRFHLDPPESSVKGTTNSPDGPSSEFGRSLARG